MHYLQRLFCRLKIVFQVLFVIYESYSSFSFFCLIPSKIVVYNLGYVALDLLASPSVEMREAALRLLAFHFTGIDGKVRYPPDIK